MPVTKTARDGVNTQFSDGTQARNVIVVDEANVAISPLAAADFDARIGEVQATPTANTVLDRLKALATLLAGGLPAALSAAGGLKIDLVTLIAGEDLTNNRLLIGRKPADSDSALTTMQNAAAATGNGTAVNLKGYAGLCIEITTDGSGSGIDYAFEATLDDTNWRSIGLLDATTGTISTGPTTLGASAAKLYYLPGGGWGLSQVRARVAARSAGTTTARGRVQP